MKWITDTWNKGKGRNDYARTPRELYEFIINDLQLQDLCDGTRDFFSLPRGTVGYCNPPFSRKKDFIMHAIYKNYKVLFLLPASIDTEYMYIAHYNYGASIGIIVGSRLHAKHAKYPSMFVLTDGKGRFVPINGKLWKNDLEKFVRDGIESD